MFPFVVSGLGGAADYGPFSVAGFRGARGGRHDRLGAQGRRAGGTTSARRALPFTARGAARPVRLLWPPRVRSIPKPSLHSFPLHVRFH